jgi:hypothetical protein
VALGDRAGPPYYTDSTIFPYLPQSPGWYRGRHWSIRSRGFAQRAASRHNLTLVTRRLNHTPPVSSLDAETVQPGDGVLWIHPVLCELGLPIRAPRGQWHRGIGTTSLRMEAASPEHALPGGRMLRLSLIHICDAARRENSASLDLGADASAMAGRMGAGGKTAELIDQMHRMLSAKISVSWGGGPEFTIFDARSRSRGDNPEWRPKIRLSAKFLAGLNSHAVALDPRIVRELSDSPMAMDAYAWIRYSLGGADSLRTTGWDELLARFGTVSQNPASFRTIFEPALRMVFDADPSIEIAVDDEGVSIRLAPRADEVAEPAAPEQPVVQAPEPMPTPPPAAPAPQPVTLAPEPKPTPSPAAPAPRLTIQAAEPKPTPAPAAPAPRAPEPKASPAPAPRPASHAARPAASPSPAETGGAGPVEPITEDSICLSRESTGLSQCVWLRRGHGAEQVLVGVTPGMRLDPDRLTILAVEPMILQVSGGLHQGDFDRVSAWIMANRDLIDDFWDDQVSTFQEIRQRLRKVPAPGWR